ncbi:MAG: lytic transglycosylase domain-containing protein [Brevinema sp.]
MPTSRIISRIQQIESRITEIQKIGQKNIPPIKNEKQQRPNGDTFSEILDEVVRSKESETLLNDPSSLLDTKVDTLMELYKSTGQMPTAKPKILPQNRIFSSNPGTWDQIIQQAAETVGVDANLIHAVIQAESAYNPNAVSRAGAEGLMQLMPETAARIGVQDSFDPTQNIMGGATVLKEMLNRYNGDLIKSLASYNAGPEAVDRANGIPRYKETQEYVPKVLNYYYNLSHR